MYIIASIDCKFKTNNENIECILLHYGLRKIQDSLYAGDLANDERKEMGKKISENIGKKDSAL